MSKRLYKIIEIIGVLIIFLIIYRLFPFVNIILKYIFKIIMPFLIAFSIAFIFEPFIVFLEKKKINRKIAIGFIVGLFILIIYLLIRFAIPLFIKQLGMLIEMLPDYLNRLEEIIQNITNKFQKLPGNLHIDYDKIESILNEKLSKTIETFTSTLQRSFSYIIQFLITPILAIYFLNDYQKIEQKIKDKLINNKKIVLYDTLSEIKIALRQYVKGVMLVMVILTLAASFCFLVVGIDYAFLFGVIIGITDIIPYIGPYIGGAIVVIFTIVSNPSKVIIILIIIIVLQFLEGNFLVPKVQSKTMKTHPIMVLLSVAIFGELLGIFGMIIAVPLEKIVEIIIKSFIAYKKS